MNFYEVLASKTCLFRIRLSVGPGRYLICDRGNDPHLRKDIEEDKTDKTRRDRSEFRIYPEPGKENQFRIQLPRYRPYNQCVESSGIENPFKPWYDMKDSDYQRFRFRNTNAPANVPGDTKGDNWYLIERVAGNKVLEWGGVPIHRFAHATTTKEKAGDSSKVWFEPVDVKEPRPKPVEDNEDPPIGQTELKLVGVNAIPAATVNPTGTGWHGFPTKEAQIQKSPYYYLELYKFWESVSESVDVSPGMTTAKKDYEYYENFGTEDLKRVKETLGHTFSIELSGGINNPTGPFGSLKTSYKLQADEESEQSRKKTTDKGWKETTTKNFKYDENKGPKQTYQAWQMVHHYKLKDEGGARVAEWSYKKPKSLKWKMTVTE